MRNETFVKFIKVTDDFYVAPQLDVEDVDIAAREGFGALLMNRPDAESLDQPPTAPIIARVEQHGMSFRHIPIQRPPEAGDIRSTRDALEEFKGKKTLAFCRSGTRSITLWVYAKVSNGELSVDEALSIAGAAGYDLALHRPALEALAG